MSEQATHYGKRLKIALTESGMTQKDLVQETGLSKSGISQYVAGLVMPSYESQVKIADALDVEYEWFHSTDEISTVHEITVRNLKVLKAAKILGLGAHTVRLTLQQGRVAWGFATLTSALPEKWTYHISPIKFAEYTGCDLFGKEGE